MTRKRNHHRSRRHDRSGEPLPRLVYGLSILTAGVVFWLDSINKVDARHYLKWWPASLIVMGLVHLQRRRWVPATAWLLTGTYFLLPLLHIAQFPVWRIVGLWPLLISAAGVTLVLQALRRSNRESSFSAVAVMAGNHRGIGSQQFRGGEAVAVMGGCEIDLSSARIDGEAIVDVLAFWGGVNIRVPHGWEVVDAVTEILGGFEDKTSGAPEGAPRLIIRGTAIMGGVEVRNSIEGTR